MSLVVIAAFAAATLISQGWLRGGKVQAGAAPVAAIHLGCAAPVLVALALRPDADLLGAILFWIGAGLAWFVVRSHLESSILFVLLDEVAGGCSDRDELLRRFHAREGLRARLDELARAGLIEERAGGTAVTGKARLVLAGFARLGGPAGDGDRAGRS
jgi:hypothetical protein